MKKIFGLEAQFVGVEKMQVAGHEVTAFIATGNKKLDLSGKIRNQETFRGPLTADVVVDFSDIGVQRGMCGKMVPPELSWSRTNPPPPGIRVLGIDDSNADRLFKAFGEKGKQLAADNRLYTDSLFLNGFVGEMGFLYARLADTDRDHGIDLDHREPGVPIVRAGIAGNQLYRGGDFRKLEIPEGDVPIEEKRIHLKDRDERELAVAVSIVGGQDKISGIKNREILISDPAAATGVSVVALDITAKLMGAEPKKIFFRAINGSPFGLTFAREALGNRIDIAVAGIGRGLTEKYYIINERLSEGF